MGTDAVGYQAGGTAQLIINDTQHPDLASHSWILCNVVANGRDLAFIGETIFNPGLESRFRGPVDDFKVI